MDRSRMPGNRIGRDGIWCDLGYSISEKFASKDTGVSAVCFLGYFGMLDFETKQSSAEGFAYTSGNAVLLEELSFLTLMESQGSHLHVAS